jgi:head-tail adaptor
MQAGKFDERASIDYPTTITGEFGPQPGPWQRLDTVWGEFQDVMPSRSEAVQQGLAQARNQTRFRMRWRDDITSDMRIVRHADRDIVYQIIGGPADIGKRKDGIELMLEQYSTAGGP